MLATHLCLLPFRLKTLAIEHNPTLPYQQTIADIVIVFLLEHRPPLVHKSTEHRITLGVMPPHRGQL